MTMNSEVKYYVSPFRWLLFALGALLCLPAIALLSTLINYTTFYFCDYDCFFEYRNVEPVATNYGKDTPLTMISYLEIKREVNLSYHDVLRCDRGEGFVFISDQVVRNLNLQPENALQSGRMWDYNGYRPTEPVVCYIRSVITADVGFGLERSQMVKSERFKLNSQSLVIEDSCP